MLSFESIFYLVKISITFEDHFIFSSYHFELYQIRHHSRFFQKFSKQDKFWKSAFPPSTRESPCICTETSETLVRMVEGGRLQYLSH